MSSRHLDAKWAITAICLGVLFATNILSFTTQWHPADNSVVLTQPRELPGDVGLQHLP